MADVRSARIKPAFGGMNSEASPEYVPDNQAAVLENLLPRPGKVVLRGPISAGIDTGFATYSRLGGMLSAASGLYVYEANSGVVKEILSGNVGAPLGVPFIGTRSCSLGIYTYAIPAAGTPNITRWDGSGVASALTTGPANPADITVHLSRLFTITRADGVLNWSDSGGATADTAAEWQDDVSGLTNQIVIGDANDLSCGLGHVGKQLAILKDRSVWMLTGLTPATFAVNRVSNEWGCVAKETIVDLNDGCYFLSERGFAFFDGSNVVDVSIDIKTELLTAMRDTPIPYIATGSIRSSPSNSRPFARAAAIGRDCIMLVLGRENTSAAVAPTVTFAAIYDTRQRTWTRFSSDAFVAGAPIHFVTTPPSSYYAGATLGYDGVGNLMYLDDLATPESAATTICGVDTVDGTTVPISATSYSRIISLSSPGKTSQLQRLLLDYTFAVSGGSDTVDCWSVSLVDGQGNVLLDPTPIPASTAVVRQRFQVEFFGGTSEVQLRITLPALDPSVTGIKAAEIHDATIEFIPGRDRPSS